MDYAASRLHLVRLGLNAMFCGEMSRPARLCAFGALAVINGGAGQASSCRAVVIGAREWVIKYWMKAKD